MGTLRDDDHGPFFLRSLETGEFSDLTIICGGHEFHLHKIVLLSRKSHFFEATLRGNFAEARTSKIEIKDEDPAVVARLLSWFYDGAIPVGLDDNPFRSLVSTDRYHLASQDRYIYCKLCIAMYAVASQFGVASLQQEAAKLFDEAFRRRWVEAAGSMWQASHEEAEDLVRSVYTTTSEIEKGLRDVVVSSILEERNAASGFFCKTDKLIRSIAELAMDVATCFLSTQVPSSIPRPKEQPRLVRPCDDPTSTHCRKNHLRVQDLPDETSQSSSPAYYGRLYCGNGLPPRSGS